MQGSQCREPLDLLVHLYHECICYRFALCGGIAKFGEAVTVAGHSEGTEIEARMQQFADSGTFAPARKHSRAPRVEESAPAKTKYECNAIDFFQLPPLSIPVLL